MTLVIAGTGVYVLGKVLRLGMLGCMTAAIAFELSGAFMANIGWPLASVWSWGGWVFAAMILVLRGKKRPRAIVFLAVVIAFAIYAGNPEDLALFALSAAIFALAMLLLPGARTRRVGSRRPAHRRPRGFGDRWRRPGCAAHPAGAPTRRSGSNRSAVGPDLFPKGPASRELVHLIFQGFDGLPLLHSQWFGLSAYEVTSAYVGVIVLVLAATALVVRWRKPEVRSFGLMAVATGLLVFAPPLVSFLDSAGARIYWIFAMTPMVLAIAVLSGIGMDVVVKSYSERHVRRVLGIGFGAMAVLLGIVWLVGRRGLTQSQINIRSHSFIWPAVEVVVGLIVVWALSRAAVRARSQTTPSAIGAGSVAGSLLLLVTTGFLVVSGAPILSSSPKYPTSTPAVATLQRTVGNSIVGMGTSPAYPAFLGVMVNANLLYNVQEFTAYDPLTPRAYFSLYGTPTSVLDEFVDILSPAITSTRAARLYGISYLLEPSGVPGPDGSDFVRKVGGEDLYRVPGAAAATLVALRPDGSLPGMYTIGAPVKVTHPSPSAWTMGTRSADPSVLRLRLTNVPGWQATIDGKPVGVSSFARTMLQVRVPAGRHVVALRYWPKTFSLGIVLALCAVVALATLLVVARIRSREPENRGDAL